MSRRITVLAAALALPAMALLTAPAASAGPVPCVGASVNDSTVTVRVLESRISYSVENASTQVNAGRVVCIGG